MRMRQHWGFAELGSTPPYRNCCSTYFCWNRKDHCLSLEEDFALKSLRLTCFRARKWTWRPENSTFIASHSRIGQLMQHRTWKRAVQGNKGQERWKSSGGQAMWGAAGVPGSALSKAGWGEAPHREQRGCTELCPLGTTTGWESGTELQKHWSEVATGGASTVTFVQMSPCLASWPFALPSTDGQHHRVIFKTGFVCGWITDIIPIPVGLTELFCTFTKYSKNQQE